MNNLLEAHRDKLSHCIIVYGTAGLIFYVAVLATGFIMKHSMHIFGLLKGIGL